MIRTQTDSGIVVILDPRIQTKPYGRVFLESLPGCRITREPA
ncbi:MAG: helicase C-terminal domain-containing protein [Pirellulales bacterium]